MKWAALFCTFSVLIGCTHAPQVAENKTEDESSSENASLRQLASVKDETPASLDWVACIIRIHPVSKAGVTTFKLGNDGPAFFYGLEKTEGGGQQGVFILTSKEAILVDDSHRMGYSGEMPAPIYEARLPDQSVLYFGLSFFDVGVVTKKIEAKHAALFETGRKRILNSYFDTIPASEFAARGLRKPTSGTLDRNSFQANLALLAKVGVANPPLYLAGRYLDASDPFLKAVLLHRIKQFVFLVPSHYRMGLLTNHKSEGGSRQDPDVQPYLDALQSNECRISNPEIQASIQEALDKLSPYGIASMKYNLGIPQ